MASDTMRSLTVKRSEAGTLRVTGYSLRMTSHASAAELAAWLPAGTVVGGNVTAEINRLLERASEDIDYVTTAGYTTSGGIASDPDIADALSRATCAQVEHYLEVGESNAIDGRARTQVGTRGMGGTNAPSVGPRALHILSVAGLR